MKHRISLVAAGALLAIIATGPMRSHDLRAADDSPAPALLGEPSLSPDGSEIAFVSGGDIWTVPAAGGAARLLVSDPATEARPLHSPDGRHLAFTSTRAGGAPEVYVMSLDGGIVRRLTYDDASEDAGRLVAGRPLGLLLDRGARHLAHERRLPRARGGRDAGARRGRPLRERVHVRALARRTDARLRRPRVRAVVAPGQQSHRSERALAAPRGPSAPVRARHRRQRPRLLAHVGAGRARPLLRLRPGRGPERLVPAAGRRGRAPSRRSATGAWCGPPSPPAPAASRSSATSPSGPSTPRAERRRRSPSRSAERRRGAPSSTCH